MDSLRSFQDVEASHMLSVSSQERRALEDLTITGHKGRSHVGSCVKGCNACRSASDFIISCLCVRQTMEGLHIIKGCVQMLFSIMYDYARIATPLGSYTVHSLGLENPTLIFVLKLEAHI